MEPPAASPSGDVGRNGPEHDGVAADLLPQRPQAPSHRSARGFGRRAILERDGELDVAPEWRRAESSASRQLITIEGLAVSVGHRADSRVVRDVGLDDGAARPRSLPARPIA